MNDAPSALATSAQGPRPGRGEGHAGPLVLPDDAYNRALVSNVRPPDWANPEPAGRYNLVVLGAGTAGLVTAAGAAALGAKVALVERHLLGGDCLNVGCVPSKCVIRSSRVLGDLRDAADLGIRVRGEVAADFPAVMERMRKIRSRISRHDGAARFRDLGVDVFFGEARFAGPDRVEVGGKTLRFRKAAIATGARAASPGIEGIAEAGFLTNETVFSLTELPRRLAVIGGGPIGCELAQAFRRLGSEVVLFHNKGHLLDREDADAAGIVQRAFQKEGIRLVLDCRTKKVTRTPQGKAILFGCGGREETVVVDEILAGAGRQPNVEGLGLEAAGVAYDPRAGVKVNDCLRTTNPRIYAAGDVCMAWKFTHAADAAARIVIQNALFLGRKRLSALTMPWATFTDPEIAHVGLYERDAKEKGIEIETFVRRFDDVDRAIADGEEEGFVKVHVRKGTDEILGATIVARHAGETIGELTLAIVAKIGLKSLSGVVHPYPTQAEAIKQAADAYNRTRLTPAARKAFTRWFSWTR
ncbi:MAG TPA: mercuric reductase [Planctomycetota bacterium]|jgi:pyruvate/2-oxoglutarate dehydrogenase complex dihydrolipoamide dehydrogenase (E3) component|nr:mercuric reductase [Planctomycetota bacterium]